MLQTINTLYNDFMTLTKDNPVLAGLFGLWGLTVLTFFLKIVPLKIVRFIKGQATTHLVLNSHDEIYFEFLEWASENKLHSFVRNLNFNNKGRWGYGVPMISIGYGRTVFYFQKHIFIMSRFKEQANQTAHQKESITLTCIGRNHKIFVDLFELIKHENDDENYINIHRWNDGQWTLLNKQRKRNLDTVILEGEIKDNITKHIESFYSEEEWYFKHGIPYRTGILLYGPPGTGKTSLIKAICSHYDQDLYIINLTAVDDRSLLLALSQVPKKCVVAMEDIDTVSVVSKRSNEIESEKFKSSLPKVHPTSNTPNQNGTPKNPLADLLGVTLGGLLNSIDGAGSSEGRILIATANCPEKLDPALTRAGRFDIKEHIGYMTNETMKAYLKGFFPDLNLEGYVVKEKIAPSTAQQSVFESRNDPIKVLEKIAMKEPKRKVIPPPTKQKIQQVHT